MKAKPYLRDSEVDASYISNQQLLGLLRRTLRKDSKQGLVHTVMNDGNTKSLLTKEI